MPRRGLWPRGLEHHIRSADEHLKAACQSAKPFDADEPGDSDNLADVNLADEIENRKRLALAVAFGPAP
jgi:hypothetical protein